jgi:hypothetical protein
MASKVRRVPWCIVLPISITALLLSRGSRLWCNIHLLWALVGVVPLESAPIAGNTRLVTRLG